MTSNIFAARIMEYAPQLHSYFADIGDARRALLNAPAGAYRAGDFCIVQIAAAARGHKGARVTTRIRLTGVFAVLLPGEAGDAVNISAKIKDRAARERLAALGASIAAGCPLILRTQAAGASPAAVADDCAKLGKLWHGILQRYKEAAENASPGLLFAANPVAAEVLKYPLESYTELCADTPELVAALRQEFPQAAARIRYCPKRIFAVKSVDSVKTTLLGKKVYLRSGADLVIEKTEALTVVDVNSGKSSHSYKEVNFEAAREIMRQLRLRDIGGIIVCDFIDMESPEDRAALVSYMRELAAVDPAKPEIPGLTPLGLMEIARRRS